ncbi:MAG: hypothetical protein KDN22_27335 [Verrucomicrobiae bacterium]|nr:hypothetical protein [Verrucomicrobiae bacterium]
MFAGNGVRVGSAAVKLKAEDNMAIAGGIHPVVPEARKERLGQWLWCFTNPV